MNHERRPRWPILAGVLAGAVGAIAASLISLPLRSPDDLIANTATVTIFALLIGIAGGVVWRELHDRPGATRKLLIYCAAGFGAAVVVLGVLEAVALDRFISFGVPLAAVIFSAVGLLTPVFSATTLPTWTPLAAVVGALIVGGALASVGDAESGDLSLGDLPTVTAPPTTRGTAQSTTPAPTASTAAPDTTEGGTDTERVLDDLAATSFSFTGGTATWAVPETFASSGLDTTAVGRSERLTGSIDLAGTSRFSVDLTTFVSDQDRRDSRVRNQFAADPIARFTTSNLELPDSYVEGDIFKTRVSGEMTINSVTRNVTWDIEARVVGNQLDVTGELDIVLTDFDVTPPSVGGFVTVEDSARLEVLFSAVG